MYTDKYDSCPTQDECSDIYGDVTINRKTLLKNTYTLECVSVEDLKGKRQEKNEIRM